MCCFPLKSREKKMFTDRRAEIVPDPVPPDFGLWPVIVIEKKNKKTS